MGKEIIRTVLEKKPKDWGYQELVDYLVKLTGKNERTIKGWLSFYIHNQGNGVIYKKSGRESFFYAEKYKDEINKKLDFFENEISYKIKEIQKLISEKKKELGNSFKYWLRYEIKIKIFVFENDGYGLLEYRVGDSKNIPSWRECIKKEEDYKIYEKLDHEDEIVFLDAILTHPDNEIRDIAWEWFVYYYK